MRIDHVMYAAENDGLQATAERLSQQLGIEVRDGGVHPRFGTRNMILPLRQGRFVEVVEALEHPSVDKMPFGQAVKARSANGGGWVGWVVELDDMSGPVAKLGRPTTEGRRPRPDGAAITWQQIGVSDLVVDPQLPYFIHWDDPAQHPSKDGATDVALKGIMLAGAPERVREWLGLTGEPGVDREEWEPDIDFQFVAPHGTPSVLSVTFATAKGDVTI